jgi:uncharacterized protein (TIGR02246 family)
MKKFMLFLGLFILGFAAYAQQGSKADLKAEEAAIRGVSKNWLDLDRNKNVDGILELFADDGVLYRPDQEPVKGTEAIRKYFIEQYEKNPKEVANWSTDRVDVASSGDLAVEYGNYNSENTGSAGNETAKGTYVTVYKKDNGKWKVVADVVTSSKTDNTMP